MSSLSSSRRVEKPLPTTLLVIFAIIAVVIAAWYRLPDLGLRPMHTDEAILGTKFVTMCEVGHFDYDPSDYHGPVLHYLTHIVGSVVGWESFAKVTDAQLRLVPALIGVLLVACTLLLHNGLGRTATIVAMLLTAVSPMMVFYSRYYIMELPFVLLLLLFIASCWRYNSTEWIPWLGLAGISLGALHATKETFAINLVAMGLGWIGAQALSEGFTNRNRSLFLSLGRNRHVVSLPWLWVLGLSLVTSMFLFSGGFRYWSDVGESVTTYLNYITRSGGVGHEKPWDYYLNLMLYHRDYFVWSEASILILAALGMVQIFSSRFMRDEARKAFLVFLSIYAVSGLAMYSFIPYKTPWTILSIQHAFILLAGVGVQFLYGLLRSKWWKVICTFILLGVLYHLCNQAMFSIRDRGLANLRGPYAYSHTTTSAVKLVTRLRELSDFAPDKFSAQIINKDNGWPLPWYLRQLNHVGYQTSMPETLTDPIIVVDSELAAIASAKLIGHEYVSDLFGLRPGVTVMLMVEKSLWDAFLAREKAPVKMLTPE
jgi:uncharacterized protein (TIGR03663 family)